MPKDTPAPRSTEGSKPTPNASMERKSRGGRPAGSKNKPKGLVPKELANELLLLMQDQLPAEHFEYMRGVVRDGKAISTKQELDTLILLLSRNLYGALIEEMRPPAAPENLDEALDMVKETGELEPKVKFRRDVTERLKVLNSMLALRNQIERREEPEDDGDSPVLKLWASRRMEGRVAVLVQGVTPDGPEPAADGGRSRPALPPGSVAGDADRTGRSTD